MAVGQLLIAAPRFWRDETSGVLAEAVMAYLSGQALGANQLGYLRAYCVQWIDSPVWDANPHQDADSSRELQTLREKAKNIHSVEQLDRWLDDALDLAIEPI